MECIERLVKTYYLNNGYSVDVVPTEYPDIYDYYLQKDGYGIKLLMAGLTGDDHEDIISLIIDQYYEIYAEHIGEDLWD